MGRPIKFKDKREKLTGYAPISVMDRIHDLKGRLAVADIVREGLLLWIVAKESGKVGDELFAQAQELGERLKNKAVEEAAREKAAQKGPRRVAAR